MKLIRNGDKRVMKIIECKVLKNNELKLSQFVFRYRDNGRHLLMNTLSGQIVQIDERKWVSIYEHKPIDREHILSEDLAELAERGFLVDSELDEAERYSQIVSILRTMTRKKPGLNMYTILPTTGCNARCVYCYEEGYAVHTMTKTTANRVIDFICETKHDGKIRIRWFGGEPMAASDIISYICQGLHDKGVDFESSLVTNASLITKEAAHEAKVKWNLNKVQVSLDGLKPDYESRKKYIDPQKFNHEVVMRAIHFLDDEDIKIALRVNFDRDNISGLKEYIDQLSEEFRGSENIEVYFGMLFQEYSKDRSVELFRKMLELSDYASEKKLRNWLYPEAKPSLKLHACMADTMDECIVVDPRGNLYNCEHLPDNSSWGNIFDGVVNEALYKELSRPCEIHDRCKNCCFLPLCTPYHRNMCPNWYDKCEDFNRLSIEKLLHNYTINE